MAVWNAGDIGIVIGIGFFMVPPALWQYLVKIAVQSQVFGQGGDKLISWCFAQNSQNLSLSSHI